MLTLLLVECLLDVYQGISDFIGDDALKYFLALLALEAEKFLDTLVHVRHALVQCRGRVGPPADTPGGGLGVIQH